MKAAAAAAEAAEAMQSGLLTGEAGRRAACSLQVRKCSTERHSAIGLEKSQSVSKERTLFGHFDFPAEILPTDGLADSLSPPSLRSPPLT